MFVFRNRCFENYWKHVSLDMARSQFEHSRSRLFNVNDWSDLGIFTADFELFDPNLIHTSSLLEVGSYIKITFPLSMPVNWVKVTEIYTDDSKAYFVVHPISDPQRDSSDTVAHFLRRKASSIFKVQIQGTRVYGYEIGRNELINNKGEQAGNRKFINTIMAWGGWLGLQRYQWGKLTKHFVRTEPLLTMTKS